MRQLIVMPVQVAPGREREFHALVAERARKNQGMPGFERMYLLKTRDPRNFRLITWWTSIADPHAWVRKEIYAMSEDPKYVGILVGVVTHEVLEIAQQFEATEPAGRRATEQRLTPKAVSRAP